MAFHALCLVALASSVAAQGLIDLRYSWPYTGPYRVDTQSGSRGQMQGYNQARSAWRALRLTFTVQFDHRRTPVALRQHGRQLDQ